ncbi:hypothetical protein EA58_14295 [Photobacterium galatheae]|uniref:Uncharacterized protein n=2 Tax=Photobacterium galatheae TaxID=1654360 RepID=A0A066RP73_9GAMM|nr:hypothetical protein EA58_14295 [Photobacterium galatheae]
MESSYASSEISPCSHSTAVSEAVDDSGKGYDKPNETQIQLYRKRMKFNFIIVGNTPLISLILARAYSDMGYRVCIINKYAPSVGFEGIFSNPSFIEFLLNELNIESCPFLDEKSFIKTLLVHSKHKHLIHYYGEKYRVRDFGYDEHYNYFITDQSSKKKTTETDELIYDLIEKRESRLIAYLPRSLKIKQLIGECMIVNHWNQFIKGWATEKDTDSFNFVTQRPNTITLFGGDKVSIDLKSERHAQRLLNQEVKKLLNEINKLKK